MKPWEMLIIKYATPELRVCNCRQAYETLTRQAYFDGEQVIESWACPYGCSAAQIAAREHVASQVLAELTSTQSKAVTSFTSAKDSL